MPKPPKVVSLEQFEAVPGPGSLIWRPVRLTLGVRAPSVENPLIVEAEFAIAQPKPAAPAGDAKEPPAGTAPPGPGTPPGEGKK